MREIKFRFWDKNNLFWLDYIKLSAAGKMMTAGNYRMIPIKHPEEIEIMQYTGIKDRNGKEIFEGDILKRKILNEEIGDLMEVFWCDEYASFRVRRIGGKNERIDIHIDGKNGGYWFEVIGNIYENPN